MKKRRILTFVLGLGLVASLASCGLQGEKGEKGDTGATGVAGSVGPQGATGATGPQATQGTKGEDGHTPEITIGANGNWFVDGVDTNQKAQGENGQNAIQYYPVMFRNENGDLIYSDFVESGKEAVYDQIPSSSKSYSYKFTGWDTEFDNITGPTTVTAQYEHSKIVMGTYPQTQITDNNLTAELNAKAGNLPTSTNLEAWHDYGYYHNGNKTSYMFYQDIDYDKDGYFDYRGVYFTLYRPKDNLMAATGSNSFVYNAYDSNTTYWFSYDPIEWDVLKTDKGKALIISNIIIDSQTFCNEYSNIEYDHNGGNGYSNNYYLSDIRNWLNYNFYNTAFNYNQQKAIFTTTIDNSVSSTKYDSNDYCCANSLDNVFLLSYKEASAYCDLESERLVTFSTYAKIQGLYTNGGYAHWWLRSPGKQVDGVAAIDYDGNYIEWRAYCTYYGVRPAMWIEL